MLDGIVIQMISGEQNADAGLGAVVAGAYLVELRDCVSGLVELSQALNKSQPADKDPAGDPDVS